MPLTAGIGKFGIMLVVIFVVTCTTPADAKKSVLDYTDVDVEKLYEEWEENDEGEDQENVPPEDKSEGLLGGLENMIKTENFDPQDLIKKSKKGKPVMIFVSVAGSPPDQAHTDRVSARWVQSLQNAHITVERYVVAPDRVLLLTQDGSKAWEIKDYLTTLSDCTTVSFDQLQFNCTTTYDKTEL